MQHSETFGQVATALAAAQGQFPTITRDRTVTVVTKAKGDRPAGKYTYSYAPLETILGAVRKPLADNGLALIQSPMLIEENGKVVEVMHTRLIHSSGEWFAGNVPIFFSTGDNQSQAYASGLTYSRRYGVTMLLCVAADEDSDGGDGEGRDYERKSPGPASAPRGSIPYMPVASNKTVMPSTDELDDALRRFEQGEPAAAGAVADETTVTLDEATGEIISPWGADLSPGQVAMAKQRAQAANLTDADVIKLVGVITVENVSQALTKLRDAGLGS